MSKSRERVLWENIKVAALRRAPSLLGGLTEFALEVWSETDRGAKTAADRPTREAFISSLVGAAVVDATIDKLAQEGAYDVADAEFLRELNALAALRDLAQFQKNAGFMDGVKNVGSAALRTIRANPGTTGAVLGAGVGAGVGAYTDEENRLRGALRYAVPGAMIGGVAGHGITQLKNEAAAKATQEARDAELHAQKMQHKQEKHEKDMDLLQAKIRREMGGQWP